MSDRDCIVVRCECGRKIQISTPHEVSPAIDDREFTGEYARVHGVKCPVYKRTNGTYFALVGSREIDAERVEGYVRRNGFVVHGYFRTPAGFDPAENFSGDIHRNATVQQA